MVYIYFNCGGSVRSRSRSIRHPADAYDLSPPGRRNSMKRLVLALFGVVLMTTGCVHVNMRSPNGRIKVTARKVVGGMRLDMKIVEYGTITTSVTCFSQDSETASCTGHIYGEPMAASCLLDNCVAIIEGMMVTTNVEAPAPVESTVEVRKRQETPPSTHYRIDIGGITLQASCPQGGGACTNVSSDSGELAEMVCQQKKNKEGKEVTQCGGMVGVICFQTEQGKITASGLCAEGQ